jgi:hypothetical protein
VITSRPDFADHDQRQGSEEIRNHQDHLLFSDFLRTGLCLDLENFPRFSAVPERLSDLDRPDDLARGPGLRE